VVASAEIGDNSEGEVGDGATVAVKLSEAVGAGGVEVGGMGGAEVAIGVAVPLQLVINKLTNTKPTTCNKIFFMWILTFPTY
jgi:hypothetical protein